MHYRHAFHAGNFADVFKHVLVTGLLQALTRKDKALWVLDTHAGAGVYELDSAAALRTAEFADGIARLWQCTDAPEPIARFLRCVTALNPSGTLRRYPGSPAVALALLRPMDKLVLCEKLPEAAEHLRRFLRGDARATIHHRDGYEAYSLLPPAEKRALVLVDPPFERPDEFDAVAELLERAAQRFAQGVYVAWYPVKNRHAADRFVRRAARLGRSAVDLRFDNGAKGEGQMRACGLLVLNPPYGFEDVARAALDWLTPALAQGEAPFFSVGAPGT